jgi:uncharacterized protein YndB with AHSA1/START domain
MTKSESQQTLVLTRRLPVSAGRVFLAWTSPETIRRWLAPGPCVVAEAENDLRTGGAFRIVSEAPGGVRHTITGRYIQIEPDRRLRMTWLYQGPIDFLDGIETILDVALISLDDGTTEVTLTQTRIPDASVHDAFQADWPSCFDKLENELCRPLH